MSHHGWVADLLRAWPVDGVVAVSPDVRGTRNRTWIVTTKDGPYALRRYARLGPEEVASQHELIAFVARRGVPTPAPVEARAGGTIVSNDGSPWALFEHARGRQVDRGDVTDGHLEATGRALGRLTEVLRQVPASLVGDRMRPRDPQQALDDIGRMQDRIRALPRPVETDAWLLARLEGRRRFIEAHRRKGLEAFDALPRQAIHGDFQDQNLFFADGEVSGIVDWDGACMAPAAWDAVRVVDLVTRGHVERSCRLLRQYLRLQPTPVDVLDAVAWGRAWTDAMSLWLYEGIYQEGDDRLRRFASPRPFESSYTRWCRVWEALSK